MKNIKITILLLLILIASSQAIHVAVLETVADPGVKEKVSLADRQFLTNVLREQAVKELPPAQNYTIMTRENIYAMLPPGKDIEDCEGTCLAETGRNIAAEYICQARVSSFNGSLTLSAELYETAENKLIASFNGLGANLNELLKLIIQKSPEFFHHVKIDQKSNAQGTAMNGEANYSITAPPKYVWTSSTSSAPAQNAKQPQENAYYTSSSEAKAAKWPRAAFFLHAGILDAGLGIKLRLSGQNAIYMTADVRWQSYQSTEQVLIPLLIYLGGNHVHFITGFTFLNASDSGSEPDLQTVLGLNCDFGKHFGIDALVILPVLYSGYAQSSLSLDFRFVF